MEPHRWVAGAAGQGQGPGLPGAGRGGMPHQHCGLLKEAQSCRKGCTHVCLPLRRASLCCLPAVHTQYLVPPGRYSFGLMLRALEAGSSGSGGGSSGAAAVANAASSAWWVLL